MGAWRGGSPRSAPRSDYVCKWRLLGRPVRERRLERQVESAGRRPSVERQAGRSAGNGTGRKAGVCLQLSSSEARPPCRRGRPRHLVQLARTICWRSTGRRRCADESLQPPRRARPAGAQVVGHRGGVVFNFSTRPARCDSRLRPPLLGVSHYMTWAGRTSLLQDDQKRARCRKEPVGTMRAWIRPSCRGSGQSNRGGQGEDGPGRARRRTARRRLVHLAAGEVHDRRSALGQQRQLNLSSTRTESAWTRKYASGDLSRT